MSVNINVKKKKKTGFRNDQGEDIKPALNVQSQAGIKGCSFFLWGGVWCGDLSMFIIY